MAISFSTATIPPLLHFNGISFRTRHCRSTQRRPASSISCSSDSNGIDFSHLRDIPTVDIDSIRRANYNARRRLIQNRGVAPIHPEIYGQATRIEKIWKDWKKAARDCAREIEYLFPEEDPEDALIIANDGIWIERKYPNAVPKLVVPSPTIEEMMN